MTPLLVYQVEHELLGEASVWERDTPEEAQKLAYYNEGAHDMASRLIAALKEQEEIK